MARLLQLQQQPPASTGVPTSPDGPSVEAAECDADTNADEGEGGVLGSTAAAASIWRLERLLAVCVAFSLTPAPTTPADRKREKAPASRCRPARRSRSESGAPGPHCAAAHAAETRRAHLPRRPSCCCRRRRCRRRRCRPPPSHTPAGCAAGRSPLAPVGGRRPRGGDPQGARPRCLRQLRSRAEKNGHPSPCGLGLGLTAACWRSSSGRRCLVCR